ncbi:unnamed protein product [Merluccius merluccius]
MSYPGVQAVLQQRVSRLFSSGISSLICCGWSHNVSPVPSQHCSILCLNGTPRDDYLASFIDDVSYHRQFCPAVPVFCDFRKASETLKQVTVLFHQVTIDCFSFTFHHKHSLN